MNDTAFFFASKIFWMFAAPGDFLLLVLLLGVTLGRRGRGLTAFVACLLLLVTLLPMGDWALRPLEQYYPVPPLPEKVDGIIVLGGFLEPGPTKYYNQLVFNNASERLIVFSNLAQRYPEAKLVFTGGSGNPGDQEYREADYIEALCKGLGCGSDRLIVERDSRNTAENARRAFEMAKPEPNENWIIVTSAYHMPRTVNTFETAGWRVIPYPTDYRANPKFSWFQINLVNNLQKLELAVREYVGLMAYRIFGKSV